MALKKDNLPVNVDVDTEQGSSITYANEVVAIIAGVAASEVEGIAGMCNVSGNLLGKNRAVTKGVKVEIGTEEASVDLYVVMEYGTPIQKAAYDAQESVRKAIETMTNLHVVRVDVHVQGVSFEKEKRAAQSSIAAANNPVLSEPVPEKTPEKAPKQAPVQAVNDAPDAPAAQEAENIVDEAADAEIAAEEAAYDPDTLAEEAMLDEAADMTAQTLSDTEETPVQQPDADDAAR